MYINNHSRQEKSKIIIVCGAPASGKTTFAKEQMTERDIIVDLDLLQIAICKYKKMPEKTTHYTRL